MMKNKLEEVSPDAETRGQHFSEVRLQTGKTKGVSEKK